MARKEREESLAPEIIAAAVEARRKGGSDRERHDIPNPGYIIDEETDAHFFSIKCFFKKLSSGGFGLAKTYWLFGLLSPVTLLSLANFVFHRKLVGLVFLALSFFELFVLTGIWRAADKYHGRTIWGVLAKISVVLGAIFFGGVLTVGSYYWIRDYQKFGLGVREYGDTLPFTSFSIRATLGAWLDSLESSSPAFRIT